MSFMYPLNDVIIKIKEGSARSSLEGGGTASVGWILADFFPLESNNIMAGSSSSTSTVSSMFRPLCLSDTEEVSLSDGEDCVVFTLSNLPNAAFPIMDDFRRNGRLCDVDICVANTVFQAHRVVLAGSIPYFRAMFTSKMVETNQREIRIKSVVDPSTFESLINFAYSGKVSISTNNVQNLMVGSSFLQLNSVRDACEEFLMTRLTPSNVLGVRHFADSLSCGSLVIACEKYARKFFQAVVETSEEFLELNASQVDELISDDELQVNEESVVFKAVLKWTKYDVEGRKSNLPELLSKVRLPLLTPHFLSDEVASESLIRSCHRCRDLLDEARDFHLMPERRVLLQSFRTKPRIFQDLVGIIYAVGGQTKSGNSISTVEIFNPLIGRWRDAEPMSVIRSRVGVAVMKNKLYAIGGYDGSERLNTVEVFDTSSSKWSKISDMNCKRSAVGAVALGEYLYVCGGFDGVSSLDTVERYDPESDSWTLFSNMAKQRSAAGVVQLYGQIYVLGGHNGLSIFESVERYDFENQTWTNCVPMLSKRCRLGVATLNGKIYACGGYDGSSFLRSVEAYDPVSNNWSYVAPMNVTRSRVALVANMNKLWAIGGYDGMKNLSTVEMYNPEKDEWSFVSSMESHEGGVGIGVIPMNSRHN